MYNISNIISTPNGSKTAQGGLKSVNDKPMTITICRETQLHGKLCVFYDILEYHKTTEDLPKRRKMFFLAVKYSEKEVTLIAKRICEKNKEPFSKTVTLGREIYIYIYSRGI